MATDPALSMTICRNIAGWLIALLLIGCNSQPQKVTKKRPKPPIVREESEPLHDIFVQIGPDSEASERAIADQRFRPDDRRPAHDDPALAQAGVRLFESKRLKLYTDMDEELAEKLPPLADQLYDALVNYFGPLPPDRQQTEFQMTGYVMRDEDAFRETGLLESVSVILHGRHIANRFWMRHQATEYFTQHLMLHECTHCYMTFVPGYAAPLWYMEGMAELFATHRVDAAGAAHFRILPDSADEVPDWGRIPAIRQEVTVGKGRTITGIEQLGNDAFFQPQAYAWAWALCYFLDVHPRYQTRFRELSRHVHDDGFAAEFDELRSTAHISAEWRLFIQQLQYGYDLPRAAIEYSPAAQPVEEQLRLTTVAANRGWQDSGVVLEAGTTYEITASGQFILATDPKPWLCEPQGITFEYFDGQPLGQLVAYIDTPIDAEAQQLQAWKKIPIGKRRVFTAESNGRLLLRINDAWNSLDDNSGSIDVQIRRAP